jgi:hypothetical protein
MQGDQFCQRLVSEAAQVLSERGYCQFLCNWAHLKNQNWEERLSGWFKGTDCNVWVMHGTTEELSAYARKWIQHIELESSPDFPRMYDEWMNYYTREGIEAVSMGLITMQRSSGSGNWFRIDPQPEAKTRDLGEDVIRTFEVTDYLRTVQTDTALMAGVLQPSPDLRLDIRCEPSAGEWRPLSRQLRIDKGLGAVAQTDELGCAFIVLCDGQRTVSDILSEIARSSGLDEEKITPGSLHVIRQLLQRAFLLPAKPRVERDSYMAPQP